VDGVPQQLFSSAADYYAQYRPGYPQSLVDALAARAGLDGTQRVLDIGCGTGQLTIPLARHAQAVVAIDPVPGMLARGRQAAQAAGAGNITWLEGDSSHIAALAGPGADLAVFAASFHWTDRPAVLAVLDEILAPGGAVVIINDVLGDSEQPDWEYAIARIRARYLGDQPRTGTGIYSHRDVLANSAFCAVDTLTWSWSRQLTVEEVTGLQLSYSFSTPALLGDDVPAFSRDVRAAVLDLHPAGVVTEPLRVEVLIAARSLAAAAGAERATPCGGQPRRNVTVGISGRRERGCGHGVLEGLPGARSAGGELSVSLVWTQKQRM
jgi:ubiquinone/menaquinone biosynthesis C-methylase UbiE